MNLCPECHSDPCCAVRFEEVIKWQASKSHDWPLTQEEKRQEMTEAYERMVEKRIVKGGEEGNLVVPGCVCSFFDYVINKQGEEHDKTEDFGYHIPNPSNPRSGYTWEINAPNPDDLLFKYCKSDPCHTVTYGDVIKDHADLLDHDDPPNVLRKTLYQAYVREVKGGLGKGVQIVVLQCFANLIRDVFPDPDGKYMGHKKF